MTAQSVSFRSPPETGGNPVTTTVSRRVRPGHEAEYEQVLQGLIAVATKFPGHLGVEVFRPQTAGARRVPDRIPIRHPRALARVA